MTLRDERYELLEEAIHDVVASVEGDDIRRSVASLLLPSLILYECLGLPENNVDGRNRKDIYLSAVRQLARGFGQSWTARIALKMLRLDSVLDTALVYAERASAFTKTARLFQEQQEKYDSHYDHAISVLCSFDGREMVEEHLLGPCRLYASLKTWGSEDDLNEMHDLFSDYNMGKFELIVEGPVRLLLKLGPDGFLAIWRALSWSGSRDEPKLRDAKVLCDDLYGVLKQHDESGFISELRDLIQTVNSVYLTYWMEEQKEMRQFVPVDTKDRFFEAFERGAYFGGRQ